MKSRSLDRWAMIAALLAAALGLSAAAVGYARRGEFDATPALGGLFMLTVGLGALARMRGGPPA